MYISLVARQRLSKNVTAATNTQQWKNSWTRRLLCDRCLIKESRRLILPRTFVGFWVLKAVEIENSVLTKSTDVCEKCVASLYRVEELTKQEINMKHLASTVLFIILANNKLERLVTAAQSKASTVFTRWDAGIVGLNPTQGMDVWYVYVFM
jgi:hypothetical protein